MAAMSTPEPTTTVDALPLVAGRWQLDPMHSSVTFSVRHLGLSKVRGRFGDFSVNFEVGPTLADTSVEARIALASVDTGAEDRDNHLCSPEFFDVEQHPEMRFVSQSITGAGNDWRLDGDLTLMGKTHPFGFDVELYGLENFAADGTRRAGFGASGKLSRKQVDLDFGTAANAVIGDAVNFELDLQFIEPRDTP